MRESIIAKRTFADLASVFSASREKAILALTMKVYNHADEKRMRDEMDKLDAVRNVSKNIRNDNNGKALKVF